MTRESVELSEEKERRDGEMRDGRCDRAEVDTVNPIADLNYRYLGIS
jgi:hypothetical protein